MVWLLTIIILPWDLFILQFYDAETEGAKALHENRLEQRVFAFLSIMLYLYSLW